MKLERKRLTLYPVDDDELRRLSENEDDDVMKQVYTEMLLGCENDPENRIWYTVWHMALKDSPGTVIGDFCFKGPAETGRIEIGYGLRDGYCGCGYMAEAVKTISEWALSQKDVTRVEAETDPDNTASQKVLSSAGFVPTGTYGEEGPRFVFR